MCSTSNNTGCNSPERQTHTQTLACGLHTHKSVFFLVLIVRKAEGAALLREIAPNTQFKPYYFPISRKSVSQSEIRCCLFKLHLAVLRVATYSMIHTG